MEDRSEMQDRTMEAGTTMAAHTAAMDAGGTGAAATVAEGTDAAAGVGATERRVRR